MFDTDETQLYPQPEEVWQPPEIESENGLEEKEKPKKTNEPKGEKPDPSRKMDKVDDPAPRIPVSRMAHYLIEQW